MSNIVFRDDSGLLDLFDVTFTYEYTDDGGSWTGKAIVKHIQMKLP